MTLDFSRDHADALAAAQVLGGASPLAIDRQRVVHAAAFRRLQHKTQVIVAPESDHFRTRLTHTLEVAHLSRVIAARLGLNAELAEVVALAHDLGHPPFGHAGETALDECLRQHGGFEHNRHTLRIVEELEHPYPEFRGLNLTRATRQCLAAHSTQYDRPGGHPLTAGRALPAESRVVDLADRLAYALHDLQDGLYAGLLELVRLDEVELWRGAYDGPRGAEASWRGHLRPAVDRIQERVLADVALRGAEVQVDPRVDALLTALDRHLFTQVYRSPPLAAADLAARSILTAVFTACVRHPEQMPERFQRRVAADGVHRVVTDYIAGMTDRFCVAEHARLADQP
jgi:dGTPase